MIEEYLELINEVSEVSTFIWSTLVYQYKILLLSETKGAKTLAEITSVYEPLRYWGYFKSPFEDRIAALFISDFRGCEAFPQMRINIVGANLVRGFSTKFRE